MSKVTIKMPVNMADHTCLINMDEMRKHLENGLDVEVKLETDELVKEVAPKFTNEKEQTVQFTEEDRQQAQSQNNNEALLSQSLSINFETGSAAISQDSYDVLTEFANTAKILNGVVIQIEGNTDNTGNPELNKELSEQRAKSVAKYLQYQGVDPTRFVVVGNGQDNPVGDNNTEEGKQQNRRTEIFYKVVK